MPRVLKFFEAIREGMDLCLEKDASVYVIGLGVPDPKGIFGTTLGLAEKYGPHRVLDMPTSENGMTGVAIGSALVGMRPILTHQRIDFAILAMEQIVNQAAKWHYMFGGRMRVPLVIRMIIGRGWGQGPQHSQSLHAWFAHVPGLKVVMPATPQDAKGLLISSIEDDNPVIFIEHRWLYNIQGPVSPGILRIPLGAAQILKEGKDVTLISSSYMTWEALRAAEELSQENISAEVVDLRTLKPLDWETVLGSVRKTGRLVVADHGWKTAGFGAEVVARAAEEAWQALRCSPVRIALPDLPAPSSPALSKFYYPGSFHIASAVKKMLGMVSTGERTLDGGLPTDVPDASFRGPF